MEHQVKYFSFRWPCYRLPKYATHNFMVDYSVDKGLGFFKSLNLKLRLKVKTPGTRILLYRYEHSEFNKSSVFIPDVKNKLAENVKQH